MGSSLKVNAVQDLIKQEPPDLLLIQETKISDQDFQNHIKRSKNYTGTTISAAGTSGGIGTIWNKNKWDLTNQNSCNWWVRTDIKNKVSKEEYTIYNIYAPNHYRDKAICWDSITSDLQLAQDRNIFLGGDLNLIRNADEKLGGNFFANPSRDSLEALIHAHNLIDIPPHNGKIVASFPSIKSKIIQASASDHKPVILTLDKGRNLGPLPFKYNKVWDYKEEFQKLVQEQWAKEVVGSPHYTWETKLKSLRTVTKQWARDNAVVENKKRIDLHKQLEQWNQKKENIQYTEEDQTKENEMYKEFYKQNRMEEEEQQQKSRCLWLMVGDKNTSFFHNNLKLRRAGNQIDKILVEGKETSDQEEIKEAAYRDFKSLLSEDPQSLDNTNFLRPIEKKITDWQNKELD
eukprot:PITA_30317